MQAGARGAQRHTCTAQVVSCSARILVVFSRLTSCLPLPGCLYHAISVARRCIDTKRKVSRSMTVLLGDYYLHTTLPVPLTSCAAPYAGLPKAPVCQPRPPLSRHLGARDARPQHAPRRSLTAFAGARCSADCLRRAQSYIETGDDLSRRCVASEALLGLRRRRRADPVRRRGPLTSSLISTSDHSAANTTSTSAAGARHCCAYSGEYTM